MKSFNYVDLSSTFGLIATGLFTLNMILGLALVGKYKRERWWKRLPAWLRALDAFAVHNWLAYAALIVALIHPLLLLLDRKAGFTIRSVAIPLYAPHQRYLYSLGALALYGLIVVTITSMHGVRRFISNRHWHWVHYTAYAATPLFLIHGLLVDPKLTDKRVDLVDAEKVLSEVGLVVLAVMVVIRLRYARSKRASEQFSELRIVQIIQQTGDCNSYELEIPSSLKRAFRYEPGQFLTLRFEADGSSFTKRSYSLSSSPVVDHNLIITIKRKAGGKVSAHLLDTLQIDDTLAVLPPEGSFFEKPFGKSIHYVLFGAGSGITPLYSILKTVLAESKFSWVTLFYTNRNEGSIIFAEQIAALETQYAGRLQVVHHLTQPLSTWRGLQGRLDRAGVEHHLDLAMQLASDTREFYICGAAGYMDLVEGVLCDRGIAPQAIHTERYSFSRPDSTFPSRPLLVGDLADEVSGSGSARLSVAFAGVQRSLEMQAGETVLDAALRSGLNPPYACQVGVCASCKATLVSGCVEVLRHEALTQLEVEQHCILACQSVARSEKVEVSFDR